MKLQSLLILCSSAVFAAAPAGAQEEPRDAKPSGKSASQKRVALFDGLGGHSRKVKTASPDAQRYFNQGVAFLSAFNHDEAIRAFRQAAEIDPECAMAWFGLAMANGPHINYAMWDPERMKTAREALDKARAAAARESLELELIEALALRQAAPEQTDRHPHDEAYTAAMRALWKKYPQDADIGAWLAESMMNLRPWDLWTADGKPQPGTDELVSVLEAVMRVNPAHPLANHLYIHAVEASLEPGRADAAAERLRTLQPGLGHMVHMPSHIDIRRGRWQQSMETNTSAVARDTAYAKRFPDQGFYRVYMAHNHHMLAFGAMMTGQSAKAMDASQRMLKGMPPEWVKANAAVVDGYFAMPAEVLMRFGKWDEILTVPEFPPEFPYSRAMRLCARGVALAVLGRGEDARAEQRAFQTARAAVPKEAVFGNNPAENLLAIADRLLEGEILYREGKTEDSIKALREGVKLEDALRYDEPPDWIHPLRHVLGAELMEEKRFAEAEQVFREDLAKWPENGWALLGLSRSLENQKRGEEAGEVKARFEKVWKQADVKVASSCMCQDGE